MTIKDYIKSTITSELEIQRWEEINHVLKASTNYIQDNKIEESLASKYRFDFYGLLEELNIPSHLRYPIMRLNDLSSYTEYTADNLIISLYDNAYLDGIYLRHILDRTK